MPDLDAILSAATLAEKAVMVAGRDFWHTPEVERLDVGAIKVTDGPNGARGDALFGTGTATVCAPCGSALGATWDPAVVERVGAMLGQQARTKGAHVLLAPTVNLHRHPLAGRNFECYSEDPWLTGRLGVGFVRGCQGVGVGTTTKHFAGNESEFERNTIDTVADERTLRELYLVPFEAVVREADAWGLMAAYNRLNGPFCTESRWLLTEVLRDEWGFDGVVVSDWFATHATAAASAGLDLEMPGPPRHFGQALVDAVERGDVDHETVDAMAARVLRLAERTGAFDGVGGDDEAEVDDSADRSLCRSAAAAGTVLLKNDGVLPLDLDAIGSVAVVGPNADRICIMGGGSANVNAHHRTSPLEAIRTAWGGRVDIVHRPGPDARKFLPPIEGPVATEYYGTHDLSGEPVLVEDGTHSRWRWVGRTPPGVDPGCFSLRAKASVVPERDGDLEIGLIVLGQARVHVGDEVVLDGWDVRLPRGEAILAMASEEITATVPVVAGIPVEVAIEYTNERSPYFGGCYVGARMVDDGTALEAAVAAAAAADVAVVVVGTDDEWETEGADRTTLALPRGQEALVRQVAAANPRTAVVLNVGAPVETPWATDVGAVLVSWFGGQEMGHAIADVLAGVSEPGGRLPGSWPVDVGDVPVHGDWPGGDGRVEYGEGVFMGYRGYDASGIEPAWCFGHGLGYTDFTYGEATTLVADGTGVVVEVPVTNAGDRPGTEVVQAYVAPPAGAALARPPKELKAFAKVAIDPGATVTVRLAFDERSFAAWDTESSGWLVAPGTYEIRVGRSSRDIRSTVSIPIPSP